MPSLGLFEGNYAMRSVLNSALLPKPWTVLTSPRYMGERFLWNTYSATVPVCSITHDLVLTEKKWPTRGSC